MTRPIIGTRIRERRRTLGIAQSELARRVGISASYLNLIEHNRRGIAGSLLRRTAEALDLRLDEIDGAAEQRLLEGLEELAQAPDLRALKIEAASAGDLIGRYPGWARAIAALARSEQTATAAARALSDRLTHDPFLGEAVHRMLTRVAAIRSAAEILVDFPALDPDRRARFHQILHDESRILSEVGEALAGYFDKIAETDRQLTPLDEVEALFEARDHRFAEIDAAARELSDRIDETALAPRRATAQRLAQQHLAPTIEQLIDQSRQVETATGRARARRALTSYATAAILAPMAEFAARAAALGYDIEALEGAFALGIETVCKRLTALPPGPAVPRFGYFCANAAGTIVERRGLPGLVGVRHAQACPLWVLYRAQQSPEAVIRQRAAFPVGGRFIFLARARNTGPTGFGRARHYLTDMLVMTEADASRTVYAPDPTVPIEEVGPGCRICPRDDCAHRVEDPLSSDGAESAVRPAAKSRSL